MDERFRVPDRRYKSGYRLTARGQRNRQKWITLIVLLLVMSLVWPQLSGFFTVTLIAYGFWRGYRNRAELRSAQPPVPLPPAQPVVMAGEARVRKPILPEVKAAVFRRDEGRCRGCGISEHESRARYGKPLHYDHIIPFSKNGLDTVGNLQLLCETCNLRKGAK